jgi:ribonuclease HI
LLAALEALRTFDPSDEPVRIVADSTFVVNCFWQKWWVRWEANGYRNSNKQPVANADLWKPLVEFERTGNVEWAWVKGHSGDRLNDLVDGLAVAAIRR